MALKWTFFIRSCRCFHFIMPAPLNVCKCFILYDTTITACTCVQQILFACTVCDKEFTRKGNLNVHRQRRSVENMYSCDECEASFLSQNSLSHHKNIHTGKHKCTECGKCCQRSADLAAHMRSHSGEKPFECTVCGKRFTMAGNLFVHSRIHSGEKPYKCSQCNVSFTYWSTLQKHKCEVHSNRRPYQCRYCEMLFETNAHLKCHVCVHIGAKPYSCRHCSECFTKPDQLETHLLKSHNEGT